MMNERIDINEDLYRHAKFLQNLKLNKEDIKVLRLFIKLKRNFTDRNKTECNIKDQNLINQEIAVEY